MVNEITSELELQFSGLRSGLLTKEPNVLDQPCCCNELLQELASMRASPLVQQNEEVLRALGRSILKAGIENSAQARSMGLVISKKAFRIAKGLEETRRHAQGRPSKVNDDKYIRVVSLGLTHCLLVLVFVLVFVCFRVLSCFVFVCFRTTFPAHPRHSRGTHAAHTRGPQVTRCPIQLQKRCLLFRLDAAEKCEH